MLSGIAALNIPVYIISTSANISALVLPITNQWWVGITLAEMPAYLKAFLSLSTLSLEWYLGVRAHATHALSNNWHAITTPPNFPMLDNTNMAVLCKMLSKVEEISCQVWYPLGLHIFSKTAVGC